MHLLTHQPANVVGSHERSEATVYDEQGGVLVETRALFA